MKDFNRDKIQLHLETLSKFAEDGLDYYVPFANAADMTEPGALYPCTGKVYSYRFSTVYSGSISFLRPLGVLSTDHRWLCDDAYSVFADHIGDGFAFGVHNAGREGSAEVALLACLAPQRHAYELHAAHDGYDTVLQLQYLCRKNNRSWAQPHCGLGSARHAGEGFQGFILLYLLKKFGVAVPDVATPATCMPFAGRVVSETLLACLDRADVITGLKAATRYLQGDMLQGIDDLYAAVSEIAEKYKHVQHRVIQLRHPNYHTDPHVITEQELA